MNEESEILKEYDLIYSELIKVLKYFKKEKDLYLSENYISNLCLQNNLHAPNTPLLPDNNNVFLAKAINRCGFIPIVIEIIKAMIINHYYADLKRLIPRLNPRIIYHKTPDHLTKKGIDSIIETFDTVYKKIKERQGYYVHKHSFKALYFEQMQQQQQQLSETNDVFNIFVRKLNTNLDNPKPAKLYC